MKTLLIISIFLFISTSISAQMYERTVGVRLGYASGVFFEKQNDDLSSYRFMYSWRDNGRHFTAMKLFRRYKLDELPESFSFYYGYGTHVGFVRWSQEVTDDNGYYWSNKSAPVLGVDIMIGLSYDFERLPISLTGDVKPYFDFFGKTGLGGSFLDFSIGAVYSF